jgi:hypothetical protein
MNSFNYALPICTNIMTPLLFFPYDAVNFYSSTIPGSMYYCIPCKIFAIVSILSIIWIEEYKMTNNNDA